MEIYNKINNTHKNIKDKSIFDILPLEIIQLILKLIRDTQLILKLRLVNRYFCKYYFEVPNYLHGYKISKFCFDENKWYKKSNTNQILKEIIQIFRLNNLKELLTQAL